MSKRSLNLNILMEETFDVICGPLTLHVKKPTEEMALKINTAVQELEVNKTNLGEVLPKTAEITTMILNHNIDGIVVPTEVIANMPINVRMVLIKEYASVIGDIESNPS